MQRSVDYILVGQGLAGTCLAVALLNRNKTVHIIDSTTTPSSSKVAAGLYNPITGRKMVKTWKADDLFPYLIRFYKGLEKQSGHRFLQEKNIYRPFISFEEQNEWMGKSATPEYGPFVKKVHTGTISIHLNDPYGGIELAQSGYLDVPSFLLAMRGLFARNGMLSEQCFDPGQLEIADSKVCYDNLEAKRVIFCDGTQLSENPFFSWLPFRPVKGEVLTVESTARFEVIANRGVFCVPLGDGRFRVGSNYDNRDLSWEPTDKARHDIEEKLRALLRTSFTTVDQKAGVRPATLDRRPYIGIHPDHETIGVFNGLGTKGVSLAPYFGEHFAAHLEENKQLDERINISRYFSLYFYSQK